MATDILYTGKGLATKLPSDDGGAMSRLSNFITKAEEVKYQAFKDNKDWFLKTQEVDPVAFLTTANQDAQRRLLDKYNKASSAIVNEAGGFGNLSGEAQSKILAGKNLLMAEQQKMKSAMDQFLLEKEVIDKDKGATYDPMEFYKKKMIPYLETGTYDKTPLQPRAKSIANELIKLRGKIGQGTSVTRPTDNAPGFQETVETIGNREDVAPIIVDAVFRDEGYKRDMLEKWDALPQEKKNEYLDTDNSGDIDEIERKEGSVLSKDAENPILKFYIDSNYKYGIKEGLKGKPSRINTGSVGGFSTKSPVSGANNKNGAFDVRENVSSYGTTFGKLMNLGRVSFTSDPQTIESYVDLATGDTIPLGAGTRFEVVSYSPDRDLIVAKIVDDVRGKIRKGTVIGLKGSDYKDLLANKPFYLDRESLLKKYGGEQPTQTTKKTAY